MLAAKNPPKIIDYSGSGYSFCSYENNFVM